MFPCTMEKRTHTAHLHGSLLTDVETLLSGDGWKIIQVQSIPASNQKPESRCSENMLYPQVFYTVSMYQLQPRVN